MIIKDYILWRILFNSVDDSRKDFQHRSSLAMFPTPATNPLNFILQWANTCYSFCLPANVLNHTSLHHVRSHTGAIDTPSVLNEAAALAAKEELEQGLQFPDDINTSKFELLYPLSRPDGSLIHGDLGATVRRTVSSREWNTGTKNHKSFTNGVQLALIPVSAIEAPPHVPAAMPQPATLTAAL
jgi:hypothetical protein